MLPGFEPSARDALFFAVMPDEDAAIQIERGALELRNEHGLRGKLLGARRFHVTLCEIGHYDGVPRGLVAKAAEAAQFVEMPPFEVVFDRAMSFQRRARKRPFVLLGGEVSQLLTLQQSLVEGMKRYRLGRRAGACYMPHVTMLYDFDIVLERSVQPVGWTVREFVLIHSLQGKTQYVLLGQWPLRG